jgi:hypothetical protein
VAAPCLAWPVCAIGGNPSVGKAKPTLTDGGMLRRAKEKRQVGETRELECGSNHDLAHLLIFLSPRFFFLFFFSFSHLSTLRVHFHRLIPHLGVSSLFFKI